MPTSTAAARKDAIVLLVALAVVVTLTIMGRVVALPTTAVTLNWTASGIGCAVLTYTTVRICRGAW